MTKAKPVLAGAAAAAAALILAACGGSTSQTSSAAAGGGGGDGASKDKITIMSPKDGASVKEPFTLKFDAGDIGPTDSGKDHVHIFADGKEADYTVVTKNTFQIKGLSAGEHTINITKQHADHSPTGAKAEIKVKVTSGGSSGGDDSGTKDNQDYGY